MAKLGINTTRNSHLVHGTFVIVLQIVLVSSALSIRESFLFQTHLCDMGKRLALGCARPQTDARGLLPCSLMCNLDDTCVGVSTDQADNCYLHETCPELTASCSVTNRNYKHMARNCANGGTWLTSKNRCHCPVGTFGTGCEDHHRTCKDFIGHGYQSGEYNVLLKSIRDDHDLFPAKCLYGSISSYTNSQFFTTRGQESFNFNRTWEEYRNGFKDNETNFWIGLESIYRQTRTGNNRFVIYIRFIESPVTQVVARYRNFRLSDENSGYRITFDSYSRYVKGKVGSSYFGDCLGEIKDILFSTWDRDQDQKPTKNCALDVGSGWWFRDCNAKCNLFGYSPKSWGSYPYEQRIRVEGVRNETFQVYAEERIRVTAYLENL